MCSLTNTASSFCGGFNGDDEWSAYLNQLKKWIDPNNPALAKCNSVQELSHQCMKPMWQHNYSLEANSWTYLDYLSIIYFLEVAQSHIGTLGIKNCARKVYYSSLIASEILYEEEYGRVQPNPKHHDSAAYFAVALGLLALF